MIIADQSSVVSEFLIRKFMFKMRVLLMITLSVLVTLALSSPIDLNRQLINRPPKDLIFRTKHSAPAQVKGHNMHSVKGRPALRNPEWNLRKGEYMCGNKVCRLQPGEIPKGCQDHFCQYPLALASDRTE